MTSNFILHVRRENEKQGLKKGAPFTAAAPTAAERWEHPTCRWTMGKEDVVHPHSGLRSSLRKEGGSDACCSVEER